MLTHNRKLVSGKETIGLLRLFEYIIAYFGVDMRFNNFYIVVANLPDRNQKVAEIIYENHQWVEVSKEKDEVVIQFYGYPEKNMWEFTFDEAVGGLTKAKDFLLSKLDQNNQENYHEKEM